MLDSILPETENNQLAYEVNLPEFQGPLDLLLGLIEQEEMDITKVALAKVTDQYLAYIAIVKELEPDMLVDFLVIAAKLILIKSKALLPKPPTIIADEDGEEDVGDELARQLRAYKRFKEIAAELKSIEDKDWRSFVRVVPLSKLDTPLEAGTGSLADFLEAACRALAIKPPEPGVDEVVAPVQVTLGEQMALIRQRLTAEPEISFNQLLSKAYNRLEVIVTFLAVLELIKRRVVDVAQTRPFGDITIFKKDDAPELTEADWSELMSLTEIS